MFWSFVHSYDKKKCRLLLAWGSQQLGRIPHHIEPPLDMELAWGGFGETPQMSGSCKGLIGFHLEIVGMS